MGVFDYISSLFDDKDEDGTSQSPAAQAERNTALAPSLDPARINAQHRRDKQRKKKGTGQKNEPELASGAERRSKEALQAPSENTTPARASATRPAPAPARASATSPAQAPARASAPAVDPRAASASGSGVATIEAPPELTASEADDAIDAAFGAGASESVTHVSAIARELDQAAVRELYAGIAAQHARPVKNFVFELKRGTAAKEWIEICRPVMATLVQGAEAMGLPDAARPMKDFDEALALAAEGPGEGLDPTVRDLLLAAWNEMMEALPEAFQTGDDERRRESVIIHSLLKQIPDVGTVTFERLYGAGLTSLEGLFLANQEDLAVTTGIPHHLCARICDRVQEHRREYERMQRVMGMVERRERLRLLLDELRRRHAGFERASADEWRDPSLAEEKRAHRQGRQVSALKIEVVLAEMGELELIDQLQKLPFQRRIERLEEFIQSSVDAGDGASAAPQATWPVRP